MIGGAFFLCAYIYISLQYILYLYIKRQYARKENRFFQLRPCDHTCNDLIHKPYAVAPFQKNKGCDHMRPVATATGQAT
jgi:hypothetical protein